MVYQWSDSAIEEKKTYHRYLLRSLAGMCAANNWKCATFIQPIPLIGKSLTPNEIRIQDSFYRDEQHKEKTREIYQKMVTGLVEKISPNYNVFDLTQVFAKESGDIYRDHIHYQYGQYDGGAISKGNQILMKAIGDKLQTAWSLKNR